MKTTSNSRAVILARILPKMNTFSQSHGLHGVVLGCGKGGDTMDITFTMAQVLEKARDRMNAGAIAIADIRKCKICSFKPTAFI